MVKSCFTPSSPKSELFLLKKRQCFSKIRGKLVMILFNLLGVKIILFRISLLPLELISMFLKSAYINILEAVCK